MGWLMGIKNAGCIHRDRTFSTCTVPQDRPVVSGSVLYEHPLPYASGVRYYFWSWIGGRSSSVAVSVVRSLTVAISYHKKSDLNRQKNAPLPNAFALRFI